MGSPFDHKLAALMEALFGGDPSASAERRAAARRAAGIEGGERAVESLVQLQPLAFAETEPLDGEVQVFVDRVAQEAPQMTDDDFTPLRQAGLSEDRMFEITLASAVGAALARLEAGRRAIRGES